MSRRRKTPDATPSIEQIPLADLRTDPKNARRHGERNLEAIASSLRRFGQQKPIVVDRTGLVVAGNGTVEAARKLGWETIAVIRTELEGDAARAFAIADNRTASLAEWDLEELLGQLGGFDESLAEAAGFTSEEIEALAGTGDGPGHTDATPKLGGTLLYQVVVTCRDERHQGELLDRFEAEGLDAKAMIV